MLAFVAAPAIAQRAGPPVPVPTRTPAELSVARAAAARSPAAPARPCRQERGDAIVVCGTADGRSAYRLPLPDERGAADGARIAVGDARHVDIGRSPKTAMPNTGLRLSIGPDKTTLAGLGPR